MKTSKYQQTDVQDNWRHLVEILGEPQAKIEVSRNVDVQ